MFWVQKVFPRTNLRILADRSLGNTGLISTYSYLYPHLFLPLISAFHRIVSLSFQTSSIQLVAKFFKRKVYSILSFFTNSLFLHLHLHFLFLTWNPIERVPTCCIFHLLRLILDGLNWIYFCSRRRVRMRFPIREIEETLSINERQKKLFERKFPRRKVCFLLAVCLSHPWIIPNQFLLKMKYTK